MHVNIDIPKKILQAFLAPRGEVRYRVLYGGRGSGKSFSAALMACVFGYSEKLRFLCTREFQNSIKESFYAEIVNAIKKYPFLEAHYTITNESIVGKNGTEFIFKGLRNNISSIKSLAQIDICIIEEAETVPEYAWVALEPTIRAKNSEIWVIYNPNKENSPTDARFIKFKMPNSIVVKVNYLDNPFFPDVLEKQRKIDLERMDYATYCHIWEGDYLKNSNAQVFANKWEIKNFEPQKDWDGAYFGADFGFSQDPSTIVKCWVNDGFLYIEKEAGGVGIETTELPALYNSVTDGKIYAIYCDSSRPETISYLRHNKINAKAVIKGAGSVEDGISHMRGYKKIIIHPSCKNTIKEFSNYSYKVDRLTNDVLPIILDDNNHYIDAIRYALNPIIKGNNNSIFRK